MGREKLYIKGIEISKADDLRSTQEYINTLSQDLSSYKEDVDEKIEEAEKWLAGKRFYFADSMDSIDNIQALVVEAKETGWENIVLVVCGGFIEELHGLYTVTNTTLTTTEEGKNSGDVTFTMLHPGKRSFNIEYATFNDTGYNETTASEQTIVLTIQNDMLTGMDYPTTNEKLIARYLPTHASAETPAYMPTVAANPASKGYVDSLNPIIFLDGTTETTLAVDIREKIFPMLKDETVVRYPMFYVYPNDSEFNIGVAKIEDVADDHFVLKSIDEYMRTERTTSNSWIIPSVDYLWIDHDYINVRDIRKQTNQNGAPALVLETGAQYTEPYEPKYDGSPATKKYVDDSILSSSNNVPLYTISLTDSSAFTSSGQSITNEEELAELLSIIQEVHDKGYSTFLLNVHGKNSGTSCLLTSNIHAKSKPAILYLYGYYTGNRFTSNSINAIYIWQLALTLTWTDGVVSFRSSQSLYKTSRAYLGIDNTAEYTPTKDYHPATKKYIDDKTNTLYFEGTSDEWNALTATEQDSFLVSLVEPMAETDEDIEETLQAIFLDETPTETEDDLTEDEANIQLDRIIEGGTI